MIIYGLYVGVGLVFQAEIIGDHGDKFGIGGLSARVLDSIAEKGIENIKVSPVPSNLDSVADGPLYLAGRGLEPLGNAGVKLLGDAAAEGGLKVDHADCLTEIVIALYVGGDAYHEEYGGDLFIQGAGLGAHGADLGALGVAAFQQVQYALVEGVGVDGLEHIVFCPKGAGLTNHVLLPEGADDDGGGGILYKAAVETLKELKAVHAGHYEIAQQYVVAGIGKGVQGCLPIGYHVHLFYALLGRKVITDGGLKLCAAVCQKNAVFSHLLPP